MAAPHVVDRPVVAFTVFGSCETRSSAGGIEAEPSTAWIEPAAERRSSHAGPSGACVLAVLPDLDGELFRGFRGVLVGQRRTHHPAIGLEATQAWRDLEAADATTPVALVGHILALLTLVGRAGSGDRHHPRGASWERVIRDLLNAHFRERLDLGALAGVANVDPAHLARTFRVRFGTTIGSYVRRLRVTWAAEQLRSTDTPISELALAAGFFDQSHFSREFRRQIGQTPARYRQLARRRTR